jgi:CDP-diacylglycerol--serine O-phosphatidyltransferase
MTAPTQTPLQARRERPPRRNGAVRSRLRRGAYLLPSLFTIGNVFLGFYAIVVGLRGDFRLAALLVFAAAFIDGLDGRIARLSGTDSDFGKEYDSLADVVTFGVTPALLGYCWGLDAMGRIGWLIPLFYLVCTATRLARFNVQSSTLDKRYFVGLPAPAAAGAVGSFLYFAADERTSTVLATLLLVFLSLIAVLMVSNFRYWSFKDLDFRRRWSFRVALPIALIVVAVALHPAAFFLAVSGTYAVSGPLLWVRSRFRRRDPESAEVPSPEKA